MEIRYQYSKKDFIDFYKVYFKSHSRKKSWFIILVLICAATAFGKKPFDFQTFALGMLGTILFLVSIFYFIPLLRASRRLDKSISEDKSFFEHKKLTIVDDGLLIESETNTKLWVWESFTSAYLIGEYLFLLLADKRMILLPKRFFSSENELTNFLGLVQSKIISVRGVTKFPVSPVSRKPSYYLGLVCLIPVAGALLGVYLLYIGIFYYKDKWFILMGAFGIALSAVLWSANFYTNAFGFKTEMAKASQGQLNNLMAQIEFYKAKNGNYPDSLKQLQKDNTLLDIYDPLKPGGDVTKADEYNYKRTGNHYYLFSSGIDGIAGTADDIYPQVSKNDLDKFGLIHK
jgi:hypothetical protein